MRALLLLGAACNAHGEELCGLEGVTRAGACAVLEVSREDAELNGKPRSNETAGKSPCDGGLLRARHTSSIRSKVTVVQELSLEPELGRMGDGPLHTWYALS